MCMNRVNNDNDSIPEIQTEIRKFILFCIWDLLIKIIKSLETFYQIYLV